MKPLPPNRLLRRSTAFLLLALLLCATAQAETVPALVNYQGRFANPENSPLPTADYTLTFNVCDATTNGSNVWGTQVFDGAAAHGRFKKGSIICTD